MINLHTFPNLSVYILFKYYRTEKKCKCYFYLQWFLNIFNIFVHSNNNENCQHIDFFLQTIKQSDSEDLLVGTLQSILKERKSCLVQDNKITQWERFSCYTITTSYSGYLLFGMNNFIHTPSENLLIYSLSNRINSYLVHYNRLHN